MEGYLSPSGPLQYMTDAEKEKIHIQAEQKMQELEDSGLSREELLYDNNQSVKIKKPEHYYLIIKFPT